MRGREIENVLVTGATGFVGRYLRPALAAAGYRARLASRDPQRARQKEGAGDWVALDIEREATMAPALEGCDAAIYLVHQMGGGSDYPEREERAAQSFARAAARAGLRRIVYLGGVAPARPTSRHLASRLQTGAALRAGPVPAVELRAAMIIGHGSLSWTVVRDLSARLPAMVLPRWLGNHSWPVAIDDVVKAVIAALRLDDDQAGCYEIPGPERISHREMLLKTAAHLGQRRPVMVGVPVLTPALSSYWIGLVTSVNLGIARELVHGLVTDLEPQGPSLWQLIDTQPLPLDQAITQALADARATALPSPAARQRLERIGQALAR